MTVDGPGFIVGAIVGTTLMVFWLIALRGRLPYDSWGYTIYSIAVAMSTFVVCALLFDDAGLAYTGLFVAFFSVLSARLGARLRRGR